MDQSFLRDFAERIRQLISGARNDAVRQQLMLWAEEFDEQAEAVERQIASGSAGPSPAGSLRPVSKLA